MDVDECALNLDICDKSRSRCNNTIGDYNCICAGGFTQEATGSKRCVDIDECSWDIEVCPGNNQVCVNKDGGFDCDCEKGYTLDNTGQCTDLNECDLGTSHCGDGTLCENLEGSYQCSCEGGGGGEDPCKGRFLF